MSSRQIISSRLCVRFKGTCSLPVRALQIPVNNLNNANFNYLKIPKKHCDPHKMPLRAICDPSLWAPDLDLSKSSRKKWKSPSVVRDCKRRFTIEQMQYTLFQAYCQILAVQHAQKAFYFCQNLIMVFGVTAQWRTWEGILCTADLFISFIVTLFFRISREFRIK